MGEAVWDRFIGLNITSPQLIIQTWPEVFTTKNKRVTLSVFSIVSIIGLISDYEREQTKGYGPYQRNTPEMLPFSSVAGLTENDDLFHRLRKSILEMLEIMHLGLEAPLWIGGSLCHHPMKHKNITEWDRTSFMDGFIEQKRK